MSSSRAWGKRAFTRFFMAGVRIDAIEMSVRSDSPLPGESRASANIVGTISASVMPWRSHVSHTVCGSKPGSMTMVPPTTTVADAVAMAA